VSQGGESLAERGDCVAQLIVSKVWRGAESQNISPRVDEDSALTERAHQIVGAWRPNREEPAAPIVGYPFDVRQ
jgi:hypothetical protein